VRPRRSPERGGSITFTLLASAKGGGGEGRSARCRARRGCDFWNTGGMKILVTAFDAFGGESINPTEQALELLPEEVGERSLSRR